MWFSMGVSDTFFLFRIFIVFSKAYAQGKDSIIVAYISLDILDTNLVGRNENT